MYPNSRPQQAQAVTPRPIPTALPTAALLVVAVTAAIHETFGAPWTWLPGGAALLIFVAHEWLRLARAARLIAVVAIGLCIVLPVSGSVGSATLHRALNQALYLAFFVTALGILQDTASSSPLIQRCGAVLLAQPPGRRYSVLTIGGALMGALLNLGAISLLGSMIARGVETSRAESGLRIAEIRLRRMTLAVLRGFSTVPLWSPTSISMPLVLTALPSLHWIDILPFGASVAAVMLALGWVIDRLSYPRPRVPPVVSTQASLAPLTRLVGIVILIPSLGMAVAAALDVRLISAILIIIPLISFVWQSLQCRGKGTAWPVRAAAATFGKRTLPRLPDLRSEIVIFAGSGAIGTIILPLIDVVALGGAIQRLGLSDGMVLALGFLAVPLFAFMGLNPIVTVVLLMGIFPALPGFDFAPIQLAMMALSSWALAVSVSPLAASVRLAARSIGEEATTVGLRWNRSYAAAAAVLCVVALWGSAAAWP